MHNGWAHHRSHADLLTIASSGSLFLGFTADYRVFFGEDELDSEVLANTLASMSKYVEGLEDRATTLKLKTHLYGANAAV